MSASGSMELMLAIGAMQGAMAKTPVNRAIARDEDVVPARIAYCAHIGFPFFRQS
jgi:hypothetical protein